MCGILIWVNRERAVNTQRFCSALMQLRHRGPDAQRCYFLRDIDSSSVGSCMDVNRVETQPSVHVAMGHTRLSIIDLSDRANQPFLGAENEHVLVYNGEIYDYLEHQQKYADLHGPYQSQSDTEVLFKALVTEGLGALPHLNGMWAFAFLDRLEKTVCLARDPFGKKPLFYYHDAHNFIAASEVKAIFAILNTQRTLDEVLVSAFLLGKLAPVGSAGRTLYKGILELPPGNSLQLNIDDNTIRILSDNTVLRYLSASPRPATLKADLSKAIRLRLRADVPLGIQVSGGVDSSAVAGFAKKYTKSPLKFFTVQHSGPDGTPNTDLSHARNLSRHLDIELIEIELFGGRNPHDDFLEMTKQYEQPVNPFLVSYSGFLMNREIARAGIKVFLDGTGGDEMFGGYSSYHHVLARNHSSSGRFLSGLRLIFELQRHTRSGPLLFGRDIADLATMALLRRQTEWSPEEHVLSVLRQYSHNAEIKNIGGRLVKDFFVRQKATSFKDLQLFDIRQYQLPYYLFVNDQNAMMFSLENRAPLLDVNLIKYINVADSEKMRRGYNKHLLRESLPDNIPESVRWRRKKAGMGFSPNPLLESDHRLILDSIHQSDLVRAIVSHRNLKVLGRNVRTGPEQILVRGLYSLSLLERAWPCTL